MTILNQSAVVFYFERIVQFLALFFMCLITAILIAYVNKMC